MKTMKTIKAERLVNRACDEMRDEFTYLNDLMTLVINGQIQTCKALKLYNKSMAKVCLYNRHSYRICVAYCLTRDFSIASFEELISFFES